MLLFIDVIKFLSLNFKFLYFSAFFSFFLTMTKSKIAISNLYVHAFSRIFNQSQKYLREQKDLL